MHRQRPPPPPPPPAWPLAIEYAWAHCHLHPQFLPVVPSGLCVRDFARAVHAAERLEPEVVVKVCCPRTGASLQGHAWLHPGDAVQVVRRPAEAATKPAHVYQVPATWPYWDAATGRAVTGEDTPLATESPAADDDKESPGGLPPPSVVADDPLAAAHTAFLTVVYASPGVAVVGVAALGPGGVTTCLPPTWAPPESARSLQTAGPQAVRAVLEGAPHLRVLYTDHLWAGAELDGAYATRLQFAPVHHPVLAALRRQCVRLLKGRVPPWTPPPRLPPPRPLV